MAEGRGRCPVCWLLVVVAFLTLTISTGVWNPFPGLWDWINTSRPLSDPLTAWQERLLGVPKTVTVLDRYVVIEHRESVEVRNRASGRQLWQTKADWAAVANGLVVVGTLLKKGYEVRETGSGAVIRRDDKASAVWTFTNAMLDVSCYTSKDCELVARDPAQGTERWRVGLPGIGFVLFADNPGLAGAQQMGSELTPMPALLGFPIDRKVHVVDTASGRLLRAVAQDQHTVVHVLGGRVIHSVAVARNGRCIPTVSAREGVSGSEVWRREGYQLLTINSAGCDQRGEPKAGGNAVVAIRPDGHQALLDAGDGREVLVCADGEKILATDGVYAVVQTADKSKIAGYALGRPRPLWTRNANQKVTVTVTRSAVVITDRSPDRIVVLDPASGRVRSEVRSAAEVLAYDGRGLMLGDRRELGYLSLSG
jgi:outer membrane protein assembly factor BamB